MKTKNTFHAPKAAAALMAIAVKHQAQQDALFAKIRASTKLHTRVDFRAFLAEEPTRSKVFKSIRKVWRKTYSTRPGYPGYWATCTQEEWAEKAKTSVRTIQRSWRLLEVLELIACERGHHKGNRVITYVRPTNLGLWLTNPTPNDWKHLGLPHQDSKVRPLTDYELAQGWPT